MSVFFFLGRERVEAHGAFTLIFYQLSVFFYRGEGWLLYALRKVFQTQCLYLILKVFGDMRLLFGADPSVCPMPT